MSTEITQRAPRSAFENPLAGGITIFKSLWKHWPVVVTCVVIGSGGSVLYTRSLPKVYQASSLIEINPRPSQPLGEQASSGLDITSLFIDPGEYYQTQYKIITSASVLKGAVEAVSLQTDSAFFGLPPGSPPVPVEKAVAALGGRLTVEPVKGSRLFYLHVSDSDPKRTKRLCDAVATAYIEQNLETAINSSSEAVVWLDGQIDHLKNELERDENALNDFKQRNNLPSISINDTSNMLRYEMQEYDGALTKTRTRKQELLARQAELAKVSEDQPDSLPSSELLANDNLQALRTQYRNAYQERQTLLAEGKGENHPLVQRATQQVRDTKTALLSEVANIQAAVLRDLAIIERQEQGEAGLFNASRRNAVDLNMKEIEYHRLDRTREQNEKLYSLLLSRMKEADLTRMMRSNNLRIVETALVPGVPVLPRPSLNLALGLAGGLFIGLLLAWLRELMDNSIKTPDDIELKLKVAFLGLLPELDESEGGPEKRARKTRRSLPAGGAHPPELIVHTRPLSGLSEAARSIRTNLMFMNPDRPCRKILVSSAAPSEGKTTVACSLAISLAQGGQRVCIVDADLRRPRLHRIFGRTGDAGLTNVIVGDVSIDEVAKPTIVPNLWSVPAGPIPPNPADMLHSERFRKFVNDLADRFDRIIIDSPPVVAVTDSAIISTLVDGTVFVVRAFKTTKHLSAQGLRALEDVEAPIIGCVLNAVNLNRREYAYYHYYYYKREGYADRTPADDDRSARAAAPPPN